MLAIAVAATRGSTHTLSGTFTVFDNGSCDLSLGYGDRHAGTDVVVTDDTGRTVAIGQLGEGTEVGSGCQFPFSISNVPDAPNYGVTVSHRGTLHSTKQDLENEGWSLALTLGD